MDCSTKTVQRLIATAGDAIVAAGQTRRRRVAWRRDIRGQRVEAPIYRIDEDGRPQLVGRLAPIWPEGCHAGLNAPAWPAPEAARDGWYHGLPYPRYDLRPQGFLGRTFARQHAIALGLPVDPRQWDDDALLIGLGSFGADLPGDLLVGDVALRRFLDGRLQGATSLAADTLPAAYANLGTR
ncbi:hypothetical protein [Roseateles sp.]|uniref:hypothetical protein n=1 Tax=Roseateles sp. TaxID=1971397 RepID=UPI00359FDEB3